MPTRLIVRTETSAGTTRIREFRLPGSPADERRKHFQHCVDRDWEVAEGPDRTFSVTFSGGQMAHPDHGDPSPALIAHRSGWYRDTFDYQPDDAPKTPAPRKENRG